MLKTLNERFARFKPVLAVIGGVLAGYAGLCALAEESHAGEYLPAWDSVCGIGTKLMEGCERVRARRVVDAATYPWSAIGRLNFAGHRTYVHCSGALISERIVLTAAHCLYNNITKTWLAPQTIHFLAGYQRGGQKAHATGVGYVVSKVHDTGSRQFWYDPTADWALIELAEPIGKVAGYLGWSGMDSAGLDKALKSGATLALAGYPAMRQHVISVDENCIEARFDSSGDLLLHGCAAVQGDSGGPLLLLENGKATIVSVNSGVTQAPGKVVWTATPIGNFSDKILETLDARPGLQQMDGNVPAHP